MSSVGGSSVASRATSSSYVLLISRSSSSYIAIDAVTTVVMSFRSSSPDPYPGPSDIVAASLRASSGRPARSRRSASRIVIMVVVVVLPSSVMWRRATWKSSTRALQVSVHRA